MGLFYRRPAFVPAGLPKGEDDASSSRPASITVGIPDELSFDNIMRGYTRQVSIKAIPTGSTAKSQQTALYVTRLYGLLPVRRTLCREPPVLSMAAGLHSSIPGSTPIRKRSIPCMDLRRSDHGSAPGPRWYEDGHADGTGNGTRDAVGSGNLRRLDMYRSKVRGLECEECYGRR